MKVKRIVYFVSLLLFAVPTISNCAPIGDFEKMRVTYQNYLIKTTNTEAMIKKGSTGLRAELDREMINGVETFYFPSIDYNDGFTSAGWPAAQHLTNALTAAVAAIRTRDWEFRKIAVGLTYYWIYHDFRSTNWWWNDLGAGSSLSNVGLFVFDALNEQGKMVFRSRIARTSFYYTPSLLTHTGANLIDYADNTLKSAIINRDPNELNVAIKRVEEEVTDENVEGFQKDGSFFQHGQQLQTLSNYGRSVMRIGRILHIISKTKYRFSTEKLAIITRFVLRGIASGIFKGYSNYSEVAREYCRHDAGMRAETYFDLDYFLDLPNLPDREKFEKFIDDLKNHRPAFEGIYYFDNAKFVAMNLDGLYMSFKGTAPNIVNTECVNGENRLGLNLSYGTNTCVMDEGDEYQYIAPVWDYAYIPGTTSYQALPYDESVGTMEYFYASDHLIRQAIGRYNDEIFEKLLPQPGPSNDYVYSSGFDATSQVAYLMQRSNSHEENYFTVTCIASKDGMFLLGADLRYTGEITGDIMIDQPIHTTIEQCFYKGSHELLDDNKTLIHGNAMYKVYDNHEIKLRNPNRMINGHWNRNKNPDSSDYPASGKILLAYLDTNQIGNNKYAYSIQPKSYQDRVYTLINNFDNNTKVQEVMLPSGKLAIASYETRNYIDSFGNSHQLKPGDFIIVNP